LVNWLSDFGYAYETPVIYVDNQAAIALAANPVNHARAKHIELRHFFIRDAIENGKVKIVYICTKDNWADLLTKACSTGVFRHLISKVMPTFTKE
jgi:hypothetical protein